MKISEIRELLDADLLVGQDIAEKEVFSACGSDMMSDVLAYVKDQAVLLTGLVNSQVIRTRESGIAVMCTKKRMYEACGKLYAGGLKSSKSSRG